MNFEKAYFRGRPEDFDVDKAFDDSFQGSLVISNDEFGGKSCEYWNPFTKVDKKAMIKQVFIDKAKRLNKASIDTQTGGAGTAGTALVPVYVDPTYVDRTIRQAPLRALYPRRAIKGATYDYIPLTSKGGAVWAAENATIADQVDVYDRTSVAVKYLYAKGRISGPAVAAMRGFIDPSQLDLSVKSASIIEAEEDAIINGDASTNVEEPNGLIVSITTNTTNLSGGLPTLAQIRAEFATSFNAKGQINLVVTDATTHNYVKGLLLDIQRNVDSVTLDNMMFGIPGAFWFDEAIFIKDIFMPTTASAKRMLFLDMRYNFIAVLQDMTFEQKYNEDDNEPYLLKEYITPVSTFEAAQTQIYGIA
jgi:HK97 family phage major capsid protein